MSQSLLDNALRVGVIVGVGANGTTVNLSHAGLTSGSYHLGNRYGRGEVGEIILIEGQESLSIGKIIDIKLPEKERANLNAVSYQDEKVDAVGYVQLLGTVNLSSLSVSAGVSSYPRIGDAVFSAPSHFISMIPSLTDSSASNRAEESLINVGSIPNSKGSFHIGPEKLFGRHCAILGSTGGGKSWTTARLVQECAKFKNSKVILVDATGEYRSLPEAYTTHMHLGQPLHRHKSSLPFRMPPTDFDESDFITLFEPSGKVQGPKLRAAIRSLRLVNLEPSIAHNGILLKIGQKKDLYRAALNKNNNSSLVDKPSQPFNVKKLIGQIQQECHYINHDGSWGNKNEGDISYCSSLFTRIMGVINSPAFSAVFEESNTPSLDEVLNDFLQSPKQVLRLCLSSTSYEYHAKEILANALGRKLMMFARNERFIERPLLVILDEAHNFLGKRIGFDENSINLDAFEIIAKEGRKYGLNICLATQRPRDITEGVISQMGTLIVHRLTNNNDREVIERACGEADRSIVSFLPNLKQGEVAILGVDFPIPLTIQIHKPSPPPLSDSPDYRKLWA
ncbi:ATP-binding protein [Aeromonas caviae]|uniref:ATP-binding protein n=1 Tax=Aeromonas caviae TaxID=648 RepID=UPI0029D8F325|nr:ATP-binding protein [Aeromonas caviae]MDX7790743.1 ATP-binding protein [Aeromonas caviae]